MMPLALVVDDAADLRLLVSLVLEGAGFEVATASDGAAALAQLADGMRPSVVVLDVQMPGLDGWSVLSAIRRWPGCADIPVIICTVKANDRARADAATGVHFVSKPFDPFHLRCVVLGVVGRPASVVVPLDAGESGLKA